MTILRGPITLPPPKMREYIPDLETTEQGDDQSWREAVKQRDAPIVRRGVRNKRGGY